MTRTITTTVAVSPSAEDEFLASTAVMDMMTQKSTLDDLYFRDTAAANRQQNYILWDAENFPNSDLEFAPHKYERPRFLAYGEWSKKDERGRGFRSQRRNAKRNQGEIVFGRWLKKEIFGSRQFRRELMQDLKALLDEPLPTIEPTFTTPWWLIDVSDTDYEDDYQTEDADWDYLRGYYGGFFDDSCSHDDDYPESAYEDEYVSPPSVRDYEYWFDSPEEELEKHYPTHVVTRFTNHGACRGCDLEGEIAMANSFCKICRSYSCRARTLHFGEVDYYIREDRHVFNRFNRLPQTYPYRPRKTLPHLLNDKEIDHYTDNHDCWRESCYDSLEYLEPDSPCTRMDDIPDNDEPYCQYCRSYRCKHLIEDDQ